MGMLARFRDPSEVPPGVAAPGGDEDDTPLSGLEDSGLADEASISLRNCWLFMRICVWRAAAYSLSLNFYVVRFAK